MEQESRQVGGRAPSGRRGVREVSLYGGISQVDRSPDSKGPNTVDSLVVYGCFMVYRTTMGL